MTRGGLRIDVHAAVVQRRGSADPSPRRFVAAVGRTEPRLQGGKRSARRALARRRTACGVATPARRRALDNRRRQAASVHDVSQIGTGVGRRARQPERPHGNSITPRSSTTALMRHTGGDRMRRRCCTGEGYTPSAPQVGCFVSISSAERCYGVTSCGATSAAPSS